MLHHNAIVTEAQSLCGHAEWMRDGGKRLCPMACYAVYYVARCRRVYSERDRMVVGAGLVLKLFRRLTLEFSRERSESAATTR